MATQVDFKADATLSGGMFVKGYAFGKAKHDEFKAACAKPNDVLVSVYEWGFGPCDDFMTALKAAANPATTTFTAGVTAKEDGSGESTVKAGFQMLAATEGMYIIFENLLGGPVTFKNAEFTIGANAAEAIKAKEDLVFPAATVHMSAAVVKLADEVPVEKTTVTFGAKNTAGAKPTALMLINKEQMAASKLGCTFGFYFGWFKKNVAGQNVCNGADFSYTMQGDILTLTGVMKAVTPDTSTQILKGDIQVDPAYSLFQGDGQYTFEAENHGADSMYVVIPNRLDTPVTIEDLTVQYMAGGLLGALAHPESLTEGPVAGIIIATLLGVFALVMAAYCAGKRKAVAVKKAEEEKKANANALV